MRVAVLPARGAGRRADGCQCRRLCCGPATHRHCEWMGQGTYRVRRNRENMRKRGDAAPQAPPRPKGVGIKGMQRRSAAALPGTKRTRLRIRRPISPNQLV
eukprot:gene15948-biopygen14300